MNGPHSEDSHQLGRLAEDLAEVYLQRQGLITIARNHRSYRGEIDIVMLESKTLVFVEVRFRRMSAFGSARESVFTIKRKRLIMAAEHFLQTHPKHADRPCRFDVVVVNADASGQPGPSAEMEWIRDAFQA